MHRSEKQAFLTRGVCPFACVVGVEHGVTTTVPDNDIDATVLSGVSNQVRKGATLHKHVNNPEMSIFDVPYGL